MTISPWTMSFILVVAALGVIALLLHYLSRVGRRYDILCVQGMLASAFGLLGTGMGFHTARDIDLFSVTCLGLALCCAAIGIWQQGLRRFRDAG